MLAATLKPDALSVWLPFPLSGTLLQVSSDLARATGLAEAADADAKRLNRVLQLTGFSDPVYAEAYVTVHQYDIVMDVTVLNRWAAGRSPSPALICSRGSSRIKSLRPATKTSKGQRASEGERHMLLWGVLI